jgi:hypothetical protein
MNSTKDDIILKYGDGFVSSFKAGDKEAYEFQYIKVKYNMVGVIPFVALFFKDYVYSDNHLYVYFDKNGNVVDYKFLKL